MIPPIEVPGWKVYYDPPTKSIVAEKETTKPTMLVENLEKQVGLEVRVKKTMKVRRKLREKTLKDCKRLLDVYEEIYKYLSSDPFKKLELVVEATILGILPFTPPRNMGSGEGYIMEKYHSDKLASTLRYLLEEYGKEPLVYTNVYFCCGKTDFTVSIILNVLDYYEFNISGSIKITNNSRDGSKEG